MTDLSEQLSDIMDEEEKEVCTQILKELQKELGGEILSQYQAHLAGFDWCVEIRNYNGAHSNSDIYRIWAWKDKHIGASFWIALSDPDCLQKVIDHLKVKQ